LRLLIQGLGGEGFFENVFKQYLINQSMHEHHKKREYITLFIIFLIIITLILISRKFPINISEIREFINSFGALAPIILILLLVIQGISGLYPSYVLMALAGLLFGFWFGALYSLIGMLLGASITFLIARKLGKPCEKKFIKKEHINHFDNLFKKYGGYIVFLGRLASPVTANILSFSSGLTKMKFRRFFLATFLGFLPGIILLNLFGFRLTKGFGNIWNILFFGFLVLLFILILEFHKKIYDSLHKFLKRFEK